MLCLLYCTHTFISTIPAVVYVISIFPYLVWPSYKYSVNCKNYKFPDCSTVASRSLLHSYKYSSTPLRWQQCLLKLQSTSPILHGVISHETAFFLEPEVRTSNLTISQSEVNVSMADEYQHASTRRNWWYKTSDAVRTLIVTKKNTVKVKA